MPTYLSNNFPCTGHWVFVPSKCLWKPEANSNHHKRGEGVGGERERRIEEERKGEWEVGG